MSQAVESTGRGERGQRPLRGLRRRVRRLRREAWERGEQRYYRRHSAEVNASLRRSHLRQVEQPSHLTGNAGAVRDQGSVRWVEAAVVALAAGGGALAGC